MFTLSNITLQRGSKVLFEQANLRIQPGYKAGIVGKNGCGKSSLFAMLNGELAPDAGELGTPEHCSWAHIRQAMPDSNDNAVAYALQGDLDYFTTQQALTQAEADEDGMLCATLHNKLGEIDGYAAPARAAKILMGLGFTQQDLDKPVLDFSGGWRMRLNLAQVLLSRADVLLLDEPTNHLDLEGIIWLESWIKESNATIIVISHDREFLDNTATHIVHAYHQQLKLYTGNYTAFEKELNMQLALQQAAHSKQQKHKAHLQSFVDRFRYKASKAKQAQSRIKMLERMADIPPVLGDSALQFKFFEAPSVGNPMLKLDRATLGYDDKTILQHINVSMRDGDRIGLLGFNGAGKSTLIKSLSGSLLPINGQRVANGKLKIGYFAQHQLEQLDPNASPMLHLSRIDPKVTTAASRNFLGRFNFSGDMALANTKNFSGGEKARLVLALLVWQKPNLLLLDEPTNHLDMSMRQALTEALQDFTGALVLVSHDRFLLQSLVDEFWLVHNGSIKPFKGDMDDYQAWYWKNKSRQDAPAATPEAKKVNQNDLSKKINQMQKKYDQLKSKTSSLQTELNQAYIDEPDSREKLIALEKKLKKTQTECDNTEEKLLTLMMDSE